ncbi:MAG: hypothetical protein KME18_20385 [Phormidium tanganyikae FI6-MK23]|jgi:hypothetical protein|nr:hypothetical protein [Phormidium tanganyikae FI6-MK23]
MPKDEFRKIVRRVEVLAVQAITERVVDHRVVLKEPEFQGDRRVAAGSAVLAEVVREDE